MYFAYADLSLPISDRTLQLNATSLTQEMLYFIIDSKSGSYHLPPRYSNGQYIDLSRSNGLSIFYPMQYDTEAYNDYINNELFSFTVASSWSDFLQGLDGITAIGPELAPSPGPLALLEIETTSCPNGNSGDEVCGLGVGNKHYFPIIKR